MRLVVSALVAVLIAAGAAVELVAAPAVAAPPPPRDTQVVRVLDSVGTPVEGAVLRFSDATSAPVAAAATGAGGIIDITTIAGLQPGASYTVFVYADGYGESWDQQPLADTQLLVPTVGAAQLDVTLPVTNPPVGPTVAGVSGTVTDALTGAPLTGVQVNATPLGSGQGVGNSQTRADGSYTLGYAGTLPGQVEVAFTPLLTTPDAPYGYPGWIYDGITWQQVGPTPVTVAANTTTPGINAAITPYGQLTGRVLTVSGSSLVPADGAVAILDPATGLNVASGPVYADGTYAFPANAGTWVVQFQQYVNGNTVATQYWNGATDFASATTITITAAQSLDGIDAQFGTLPVTPATPVLPATGAGDTVAATLVGGVVVLLGTVALVSASRRRGVSARR